MALIEIVLPRMGEGVEEATITRWFVEPGQKVNEDEVIVEIATDKVDSEIPTHVSGTVRQLNYKVDDVVSVGGVLAVISTDEEEGEEIVKEKTIGINPNSYEYTPEQKSVIETPATGSIIKSDGKGLKERFLSPLVQSIIKKDGVTVKELNRIEGTGRDGRVTKDDIHSFVKSRKDKIRTGEQASTSVSSQNNLSAKPKPEKIQISSEDEVIVMDRMRKLIADHMLMSKQVSPHVTSVVEADVTNIVLWRNKNKVVFQQKYGIKLTFMPLFTEAVAKALRDFPGVNVSVDGDNIILRKNINIGVAVVLPSGNLIVPVIKQADQMNIPGLAQSINQMADKARNNKLSPVDIQGGTFTLTNVGTFGNIMGTPIINQPQVAILAVGLIEKKPAVIETPTGDMIAIRHKMYLSLSYDHRVVDGALGGGFLKRIADYLEGFDLDAGI